MKTIDELKKPDDEYENFISLSDLLHPLWRVRKFIVVLTALTMVLGVSSAFYMKKYKSNGFLQFGGAIPLQNPVLGKTSSGILLADYKRYAASFSDSERFDEFVRKNKLAGTVGVDSLHKIFSSGTDVSKLIEPVYPFTKLDAKELMDQPKDSSNNVIGLRLSYESNSPENAQKVVSLLGRYVMDSIVYLIYSDALRFKPSDLTAEITKLDNDIIDSKEKLKEYRRKGVELKKIVNLYPKTSSQISSQVISVTEDSARYLSPVTHLMSTEVDAAQANEEIYKAKREQQQDILLREYYNSAQSLLDGSKSGEALLRGLEPIKENVFKSKNLEDELTKEVYNMITIENHDAISLYFEKSRFIAGPSLPEHSSTRLSVVLAISGFLGLFFSILAVFGRNWWINNSKRAAQPPTI